ncbi:MAG: GNAT family N-acetyltransferase [Pseudomonadota bacterium]
MTVPDLTTSRLLLRSPRLSDTGPITLFAGDRRVSGMTTSIPHPYSDQLAEAYVSAILDGRHRERVWAIDATPSDGAEFVGLISLKPEIVELGYWIGPPFWSTGYASEAVVGLLAYLIGDQEMPEIRASVFFDNPASQQVLRKAGFVETGKTWLHSVSRDAEVPAVTFRYSAQAG